VSDCCRPAYGEVFTARAAHRAADRYRRRGLDAVARWMADDVRERGVEGASVLEVGGGVGGLHIELLRSGAAQAVNVELSSEWEQAAMELAREHHLEGRIERRVADAVDDAAELESADVVVMSRVVCCYPDPDELMSVAADRARRLLVVSFPRDRALVRLWTWAANMWLRIRGIDFRSFVHSEEQIEGEAERHGLRIASEHRTVIWRAVAFVRG
jgi:2-polyprenyl-3-methyl-5-hydroxy-6-metoxy-1,4-benzoquinol methylase